MSNFLKQVGNYLPAVAGVTAAALTGGAAAPLLAAGGLGLSSAMINADAQKDAERRQYDYTKQLNAEMNAYNTPESQMERYVKAGINPYMASVSSGTQGSAGSVSTSSTNPGAGFDRAVAIANAQADLKAKSLANDAKTIENSYLPQQIEATIAESINKSALLKNQTLTQGITSDIMNHDWNIIKNQSYTSSKETGLWPRLDRFFNKAQSNLNNTYNELTR